MNPLPPPETYDGIGLSGNEVCWVRAGREPPLSFASVVRLPPAGAVLLTSYVCTPVSADGQFAGVLADWLEDHRDEIARGAADRRVVDEAVRVLRNVFNEPTRNRTDARQ